MNRLYLLAPIVLAFIILMKPAEADDRTHKKLAEELLTLMDMQKNIERSFEAVMQIQINRFNNTLLPKNRSDELRPMRDKMMNLIANELSWDRLKGSYISVYADTFTEEELEGIIKFYRSPAGQVFVEKTPELMKRSMQISQKKMMDIMPRIQEITNKLIEEQKASH